MSVVQSRTSTSYCRMSRPPSSTGGAHSTRTRPFSHTSARTDGGADGSDSLATTSVRICNTAHATLEHQPHSRAKRPGHITSHFAWWELWLERCAAAVTYERVVQVADRTQCTKGKGREGKGREGKGTVSAKGFVLCTNALNR